MYLLFGIFCLAVSFIMLVFVRRRGGPTNGSEFELHGPTVFSLVVLKKDSDCPHRVTCSRKDPTDRCVPGDWRDCPLLEEMKQ